VRRLVGGAVAISDQGLAAGTHLSIHVLSARWMSVSDYGVFALTFTLFQVLYIVQNALVVEPMLFFGGKRFQNNWEGYYALLRRYQVLVLSVLAVVGVLVPFVVGESVLLKLRYSPALGVALGGMLFLPLIRRKSYVEERPWRAVAYGSTYMFVAVGGLALLRNSDGSLGHSAPWVALGAAALIVAVVHTLAEPCSAPEPGFARKVRSAHLNYGGWLLIAGLLGFFASGLSPWVLGWRSGLVSVASYRAGLNLLLPALQGLSAVLLFALPRFALRESKRARVMLSGPALRLFSLLAGVFFIFWVVTWISGPQIAALVYGDGGLVLSKRGWMLIGATPLAYLPLAFLGMLFKSRGDSQGFTVGSVVAGLVGGLVIFPSVATWGVEGAFLAAILGYVAGGIALAYRSTHVVSTRWGVLD
jgi:O-antigen/teichoic acid export membrane protein